MALGQIEVAVDDDHSLRRLRDAFSAAVAGGVRGPGRSAPLGTLFAGAACLHDGPLPLGRIGIRLSSVLERAGWTRWSTLWERSVDDVSMLVNVGPAATAELLAACLDRSLAGLARAAWTDNPGADDLSVLLRRERDAPCQPLLEALLETRAGPEPARGAADRLLRAAAPWALELDAAVAGLLEAAGAGRAQAIYLAWVTSGSPHPVQDVAAANGITGERVRQIVAASDRRVRAALAAWPGPLRWAVTALRRRLGAVASLDQVGEVLEAIGVASWPGLCGTPAWGGAGSSPPGREPAADRVPTAGLLVWLAGPYRPVPSRQGWVALQPRAVAAATASCLAADGGVRRIDEVLAELDLAPATAEAWLHACGAVAVHGLAVSLSGSLPDAIERVLDATGRPLTGEEIAAHLAAGGRTLTAGALRDRRFRCDDGAYRLADWGPRPAAKATAPQVERPRIARGRRPEAGAGTEEPGEREPLWLWVRVDAAVLAGDEAVIPTSLVEGLGVAPLNRRSFATRYGPVVVANDGAAPTRGSVRAVALAAGARVGDTMMIGFRPDGHAVVEVRHGTGQAPTAAEAGAPPDAATVPGRSFNVTPTNASAVGGPS